MFIFTPFLDKILIKLKLKGEITIGIVKVSQMEKNVDVLVIGGGPAGIVSAVTARRNYPEKSVLVLRDVEEGVIPCGVPYMFNTLENPEKNSMGYSSLEKNGIDDVVDEAVKIDRDEKIVQTKSGDSYHYEKLILAVGSTCIVPPIPGIEKDGIYSVKKELNYLKKVVKKVEEAENVLILGGGFIGVEFADELSKIEGLQTHLVEMLPYLLANSFDPEFSELVEQRLKSAGVNVILNSKMEEFMGDEKVEKVRLSSGEEIEADCVILGIGANPNTDLAVDAGLDLGRGKGIWVDEYTRTSDPDVFAIGDCAGKRHFITGKDAPVMLASTATAEARIAGANLYQLKVLRENKGTIAAYSTYVNGLALGSAGVTEKTAKEAGFEVIVGKAKVPDKHPSAMPGTCDLTVKLVFSKGSQALLGGQVAGGMSTGELVNSIGIAIQKRISLTELETLQMATHPCLTAPPTKYPLVIAAQDATRKD